MSDLAAAERALIEYMAQYGYSVPSIKWDTKKFMRFAVQGERGKKSGWYKAFSDAPPGATFGDYKGDEVSYSWRFGNGKQPDDFDPKVHGKSWEEHKLAQKAQREAEIDALRDEMAEEARAEWEAAGPANHKHPYLLRKGIDPRETENVAEIRQIGDEVIIPMKAMEDGNPIVSYQRILPDGKKLFKAGARAEGARATIGARTFKRGESDQVIYVCEGWATGWSIHQVTERPVLVAFSKNNLGSVVAYAVSEYGQKLGAKIILAADNDRWTRDGPSGPHNPGRTKCVQLAEQHGVEWVIPDFAHLDGKPTDFNDLLMREGPEAVLAWLHPEVAENAAWVAEGEPEVHEPPVAPEPAAPKAPKPKPHTGHWQDLAPFRVLGHNRGDYFYLPEAGGQLVVLAPTYHERAPHLFRLADSDFWATHFPAGNGTSWKNAADALMQASHRKGVFDADQMRGRGCWPEEDPTGNVGYVLHLGNRLSVPGTEKEVDPDTYESPEDYMYERLGRKKGPATDAMEVDEARDLLDLFRSFLWADDASGSLLAGWTVLAPICGALSWRPHVWVTGERGCGKTTLISDVVVPLCTDLSQNVVGNTTEAGIRQRLRTDAFPVVFDEAEEDDTAGKRIQNVLALARQSSSESGATTLKGTAHGSDMSFRIRSMFCLSSIGGAIHQEADRSRFCMLQLLGKSRVSSEVRSQHWTRIQPRVHDVNATTGRRLLARTMRLLRSGVLNETVDVFRREGGNVMGDQRLGDQFGTLYAGAWLLHEDRPPDALEARELLGSDDLEAYQLEQMPEGQRALQIILQRRERIDTKDGAKTLAVGQLVDACAGRNIAGINSPDAEAALRQFGLKVELIDSHFYLLLANSSEWVKKALEGTIYHRSARTILRSLEGVVPHDTTVRFHSGLVSKATRVPYALLET